MATVATQAIPRTGLSPTYSAASAGGDQVAPGQGVFLHVKNASASSATVTLATPGVVDGDLAVADRTVSVAASGEQLIPVGDVYRDPSTGLASITWSATTSVTFACVRV